jgi:hypothetical protein
VLYQSHNLGTDHLDNKTKQQNRDIKDTPKKKFHSKKNMVATTSIWKKRLTKPGEQELYQCFKPKELISVLTQKINVAPK